MVTMLPWFSDIVRVSDVLCTSKLIAVLMNRIADWIPEALPLLADAADDYMTEVEDVFLAESAVATESGETVSYESLRKDLGL